MGEKRSVSERILPKASFKNFTRPILKKQQNNTSKLPIIVSKSIFSPRISLKNEEFDMGSMSIRKEVSEKSRNETMGIKGPKLTKTAYNIHLENKCISNANISKNENDDNLIQNYYENSNLEALPDNQLYRKQIMPKTNNLNIKELFGNFKRSRNRENKYLKEKFGSFNPKALEKENVLPVSFKLNQINKQKSKGNIISCNPLNRLHEAKFNTDKNQLTSLNLPNEVPQEDYMELFIENLILKEKCRDADNVKKFLNENKLNISKEFYSCKQTYNEVFKPNTDFVKPVSQCPWFLVEDSNPNNKKGLKEPKISKNTDKKIDCRFNYNTNNSKSTIASPRRQSKKEVSPKKNRVDSEKPEWKDKLVEFLKCKGACTIFKKYKNNMPFTNNLKDVTNKYYQNIENHNSFNVTGRYYQNTILNLKSFVSNNFPSKISSAAPFRNQGDSKICKEITDSTEQEDTDISTPPIESTGLNGEHDTFNFTFSNLKIENK